MTNKKHDISITTINWNHDISTTTIPITTNFGRVVKYNEELPLKKSFNHVILHGHLLS